MCIGCVCRIIIYDNRSRAVIVNNRRRRAGPRCTGEKCILRVSIKRRYYDGDGDDERFLRANIIIMIRVSSAIIQCICIMHSGCTEIRGEPEAPERWRIVRRLKHRAATLSCSLKARLRLKTDEKNLHPSRRVAGFRFTGLSAIRNLRLYDEIPATTLRSVRKRANSHYWHTEPVY